MTTIQTLAKIAILIFLYYCIYYVYEGLVINPIPALGDSYDYHIPISQSFLNGTFLTLPNPKLPQWYYPGSSEAINAVFLFLHIPLTISNLFAIIVLFFCCWKLGSVFKLSFFYSLLFAATICTLNVLVRWMNAVSIDVWVAVFFVLSIILLENIQKNWRYYASLGFTFGMLIGSKYTTGLFVALLLVFYGKRLLLTLTWQRLIAFLIPFSLFGLFWYMRNYFLTGNPFYPLEVFGFRGYPLFSVTVLDIAIKYPIQMFDAFFSEYKVWMFVPIIAITWIGYTIWKKQKQDKMLQKLFLIGLLSLLFFTQFPTSAQPWIMVSSLRYSYPAFIPLILGVFILAAKYKKEELLGFIAIACMINILSMAYYPKLVLFYLPLALLAFYFMRNMEEKKNTKKGAL